MQNNKLYGIFTLLSAVALLASCNSAKHVQTSQTRVDSVAASVVKDLKERHSLDSASWANEKKQISETGVVFENDPCPPCDSSKPIPAAVDNKLEFYPNGTLKSAQGKIKSLNQQAEVWQREAYTWKVKYDSIASRQDSFGVTKNVAVETKEVVKKVQFIPWWMFGLVVVFAVLWLYGLIPKPEKILPIVVLLTISYCGHGQTTAVYKHLDTVRVLTCCPPAVIPVTGLKKDSLLKIFMKLNLDTTAVIRRLQSKH